MKQLQSFEVNLISGGAYEKTAELAIATAGVAAVSAGAIAVSAVAGPSLAPVAFALSLGGKLGLVVAGVGAVGTGCAYAVERNPEFDKAIEFKVGDLGLN